MSSEAVVTAFGVISKLVEPVVFAGGAALTQPPAYAEYALKNGYSDGTAKRLAASLMSLDTSDDVSTILAPPAMFAWSTVASVGRWARFGYTSPPPAPR